MLRPVSEAVSTAAARAALGPTVPRSDAVEQAARSALLVHALTADPSLLLESTEDRLHQEARRAVYPVAMRAVDALRATASRSALHRSVPISSLDPQVVQGARRYDAEVGPLFG